MGVLAEKKGLDMKILIIASAAATLAMTAMPVAAQTMTHHRMHHRYLKASMNNGVAANGRCGGISYGTGARRCGSGTGGPSGGLTNRN